jgi:hypothetical protein
LSLPPNHPIGAAHTKTLAISTFAILFFAAGCSGAPNEGATDTASSALDDGPAVCDPTTRCCVHGAAPLTDFGACGAALETAGCHPTAHAVEADPNGHWWLNTTCPQAAATYAAIAGACSVAPYDAYVNSGSLCVGAAPTGEINVTFDPTCGAMCAN